MLVDVIELRNKGQRLPEERLKTALPVRGVLTMTSGRSGWHAGQRNPPLLAYLLAVNEMDHLLPPLDRARVVKIERGAMLVVGLQQPRTYRRDLAE